jgi:hypothetical protein
VGHDRERIIGVRLELELRFGESYKQYKQKVPFLIPKLSAE